MSVAKTVIRGKCIALKWIKIKKQPETKRNKNAEEMH